MDQIRSHQLLLSKQIPFEKRTFDSSTEKGAKNVAAVLNMPERQIVKTLIFVTAEGEHILVMVGGDQIANSKKLKLAVGSRNIRLADLDNVPKVTGGYIVGSVPALGWQPEGFRSFIEKSLMNEEILGIGTGHWGNEILITPENLVKASNALIVDLCENSEEIKISQNEIKNNLQNISQKPMTEKVEKIKNGELISEDKKVFIKDLSSHVDLEVTIEGWLYNKRSSGKIAFLQVRDGSGFVQGVVEKANVSEETFKNAEEISLESSVKLTGKVVKHPKQEGVYELQVTNYELVQLAPEFPIGKKEHGPEFLFDVRDIYLRSKTPWAVLRIRDQVFLSITEFFKEEGFIRFDSPILQPTSCEDTTQLFSVDYYGDPMYLTQSGQLYLEAAIMSFGKAYDFGPVFRAEKSKTRNHLSEFWMMDAEMAFYDQAMNEDLQERLVKRIVKDCLEKCADELKILERDTTILKDLIEKPFKRIKHYDAKKLLEEKGFKVDYNDDMTTEEEIEIGNIFKIPVFIEDYPFHVKAFYMKQYKDDHGIQRAKCADLIAPEEAREIIGGSQREDDYETLLNALVERKYPVEDYEWYLNIRKYGSVPHSGFGIGLERTVRWISGVHHIRETIPFPRTLVRRKP